MTQSVTVPVRKSVTVPTSQARAFEIFTKEFDSWWYPAHHIAPEPYESVTIEPRVGGRWFERAANGNECDWGRVIEWDPPARVVLAWQLTHEFKFDPSFETPVEIRFVAVDANTTRVELEHRLDAYGDHAEAMGQGLGGDGGWSLLLTRFEEFASGKTELSELSG
jgi:uncharacterized protein YndB with AHSA1/START domain